MDMFFICIAQYSSHKPHMSSKHWNVTSVTEELNFTFYLISINLNLNCHMWLVATKLVQCSQIHEEGVMYIIVNETCMLKLSFYNLDIWKTTWLEKKSVADTKNAVPPFFVLLMRSNAGLIYLL